MDFRSCGGGGTDVSVDKACARIMLTELSVGQFAALEGLNVIGSVSDDKKAEFLTKELGFTHAFNYKKEGYADALKRLAPDGIDIYYDNVGGEAIDAALSAMNLHGRIGKSGEISTM